MMKKLRDNLDHDVHVRVNCCRGSRGRRGFTLLELLAVVIILAMVAGAVGVNAGAMNTAAKLRAAAQKWQELDARARQHARSEGAVSIRIDSDNHVIRLLRAATDEQLAFIELPTDATATAATISGRPTPHIIMDRTGRSNDYTASLEWNGARMTWTIYGLTGWVKRQEFEP